MAEKEITIKINDKIKPLLIILLVIFAFLAGTSYTRWQLSKKPASSSQPPAASTAVKPTAPEFKPNKTDKPSVNFFVMSFCPYGNQAEDGLKPVAELLGNKVTWQPVYIMADAKKSCETGCQNSVYDEAKCKQLVDTKRVPDMDTCKKYFPYNDSDTCLKEKCSSLKAGEYTSLHGAQELNQDFRELCAWNMGNTVKWWDFVDKVNKNCTASNADTCWEAQAAAAGLDTAKIKKCEQSQKATLAKTETGLTSKYNVSGSPTIIINESTYNGGRQPEDYKKAICSAFTNPPKECEQTLSAVSSAAPAGGCN